MPLVSQLPEGDPGYFELPQIGMRPAGHGTAVMQPGWGRIARQLGQSFVIALFFQLFPKLGIFCNQSLSLQLFYDLGFLRHDHSPLIVIFTFSVYQTIISKKRRSSCPAKAGWSPLKPCDAFHLHPPRPKRALLSGFQPLKQPRLIFRIGILKHRQRDRCLLNDRLALGFEHDLLHIGKAASFQHLRGWLQKLFPSGEIAQQLAQIRLPRSSVRAVVPHLRIEAAPDGAVQILLQIGGRHEHAASVELIQTLEESVDDTGHLFHFIIVFPGPGYGIELIEKQHAWTGPRMIEYFTEIRRRLAQMAVDDGIQPDQKQGNVQPLRHIEGGQRLARSRRAEHDDLVGNRHVMLLEFLLHVQNPDEFLDNAVVFGL
ncbi:hypothetical protein BN871_AC_01340 [Paenibacillus sp. P22]|nr:hypothetical protein BN871_AC_01340 [Paenibacillus sp. P22]